MSKRRKAIIPRNVAPLVRFLAPAEAEVTEGRTRYAADFLREFKRDRDIQGPD